MTARPAARGLVAAVALVALGPRPARAGETPPPPAARVDVALISPPAGDEVLTEATARLGLELSAAGLTNVAVPRVGPDDEFTATISLTREEDATIIDLVGTLPDASRLHRHMRVSAQEGGREPAVLAVRAVELLRDIRLTVARRPLPDPEPPPLTRAAPTPPREAGRVRVGVGAAALHGKAFAPALTSSFGWTKQVTPFAAVAGPFDLASVPSPGASSKTRQVLGLLGMRLERECDLITAYALLAAGLERATGTHQFGPMEMPRVAASASWWSPAIAGGFAIETNVWRRFGFTVESTVLVRRRLALALSDHAPALVSLGRLSYLQQVYLWFALP